MKTTLHPTLYKNNSGLIAKTKVNKYKKDQCLTENLVLKNPLLFLYGTVVVYMAHQGAELQKQKLSLLINKN